MYFGRWRRIIAAVIVALCGASVAEAQASDPPREAPFLFGPLTLAPVIDLFATYDNNLFNSSDPETREGDFNTTLSPALDAWWRSGHARAVGRVKSDLIYYKQFEDLRAVDWSTNGRLDVPINRLRPFVSGGFTSTTNSQTIEIDTIAKQTAGTFRLGSGVRLTPRAEFEVSFERAMRNYQEDPIFGDANLAAELDYTTKVGRVAFLYEVTPLTTVGVEGLWGRDRFDISTEKDSDNTYILPFVEFKPTALISGRASIGIQSRKVLSGASPDFTGTVINAQLMYTLLDRTRFVGTVSRNLEYSYIEGRTDYTEGVIGVSVQHRLNDRWDVGGNVSRTRNSYSGSTQAGSDIAITYPEERYTALGMRVGYGIRRARIAFGLDHFIRDVAEDEVRNYDRTRAYSTVTYAF